MSDKKLAIKLSTLEAIGEAVRGKEGTTDLIPVNTLADRIAALPSEKNKLIPFINGDETMELTEADLAGLVNPIKDYAFYKTKLKSVELPPHITALGEHCFTNSIINIIKTYATSFGKNCFTTKLSTDYCLDLYLLANEFGELGDNLFQGTSATEVPYLKMHFNDSTAFDNFLRAILQSENNPLNAARYRQIYFQDTLATELEISSDITAIKQNTFSRLLGVSKIKFLGDVTTLANYSFYRARNLAEVDLTACTKVPTLEGNNAFNKIQYGAEPQIKVPSALYEEWISATNWSSLAHKIVSV